MVRVVCYLHYGALTWPFGILLPSNTVSSVLERVIKKSILLAYFRDSGKRNCYIRDPLFFLFVNRAREPLYQPPVWIILPPN